jgi:5,10-methylene-tetrahydrofolate dehydrogenase/methenyl tetrahydrofolate cyclohydrolase
MPLKKGAKLIDGRKVSEAILAELKAEVAGLAMKRIYPGLAVVLVGSGPGEPGVCERSKRKTCADLERCVLLP